MKVKELKEALSEFDDNDEIFIFPDEIEGKDEDGKDVTEGPGIGVFDSKIGELVYFGDVQPVELMPLPGEE